jgi:hypothetical protein
MLAPDHFMGLAIVIVAEPRQAYWRRAPKLPNKRDGRRGTRRAWKRAHPPRFIRPVATVELGQMIRTADRLYMRRADYQRLLAEHQRNSRFAYDPFPIRTC